MNQTQPQPDISKLFGAAVSEGTVSEETLEAINVEDLGAQIQAGLGMNANDIEASEVILVSALIDDSGSIRFSGNTQAVRDGHNTMIDAFLNTKTAQQDGILMHSQYLNGTILYPYCHPKQAIRMTTSNYNPELGTPLYDQTAVFLARVLAKAQEFENNGVPCRTVSLITSDGRDEHSPKTRGGRGTTAADNRKLIRDMLMTERHIIVAMGIGEESEFRQIFSEMGIEDKCILTTESDESKIRKTFQLFSQSAVRASQNAGRFSQMAAGFGV